MSIFEINLGKHQFEVIYLVWNLLFFFSVEVEDVFSFLVQDDFNVGVDFLLTNLVLGRVDIILTLGCVEEGEGEGVELVG